MASSGWFRPAVHDRYGYRHHLVRTNFIITKYHHRQDIRRHSVGSAGNISSCDGITIRLACRASGIPSPSRSVQYTGGIRGLKPKVRSYSLSMPSLSQSVSLLSPIPSPSKSAHSKRSRGSTRCWRFHHHHCRDRSHRQYRPDPDPPVYSTNQESSLPASCSISLLKPSLSRSGSALSPMPSHHRYHATHCGSSNASKRFRYRRRRGRSASTYHHIISIRRLLEASSGSVPRAFRIRWNAAAASASTSLIIRYPIAVVSGRFAGHPVDTDRALAAPSPSISS